MLPGCGKSCLLVEVVFLSLLAMHQLEECFDVALLAASLLVWLVAARLESAQEQGPRVQQERLVPVFVVVLVQRLLLRTPGPDCEWLIRQFLAVRCEEH